MDRADYPQAGPAAAAGNGVKPKAACSAPRDCSAPSAWAQDAVSDDRRVFLMSRQASVEGIGRAPPTLHGHAHPIDTSRT
ncbi:hypothetical protein GCM10027073_22550 [Streptomyces chlorus]